MTVNNDLRAYVNRNRPGKKLSLILTGWMSRVHFFRTRSNVHIRHDNCSCYPKKFIAIIGKNFVSVPDTGLARYRVYNQTYTRTRMTSKRCVRELRPLVKSPEKYRGSGRLNYNVLWFYCLDDVVFRPCASPYTLYACSALVLVKKKKCISNTSVDLPTRPAEI